MNAFNKSVFFLLLLGIFSCSQGGEPDSKQAPSPLVPQKQDLSPPDLSDLKAANKVVPVQLSPEDQEKAAKAPKGMVFIKGGCFKMGNETSQVDEQPLHKVCLDDFYMDKYEVTQARWKKVMGFNPAKFVGDDRPVEQINYFDIQEFIQKSGGECRLPTEAEWEYAAGGGTRTRYFWGNLMDERYAWFGDDAGKTTHPVGKKLPNQFGLYDTVGNVWEWVNDWYEPTYSAVEIKNPQGPKQGEYKVIRGGSFDSSAGALRTTNRTWIHPKNRVYTKITSYGSIVNEVYNYIGFRCARSIGKESAPSQDADSTPDK